MTRDTFRVRQELSSARKGDQRENAMNATSIQTQWGRFLLVIAAVAAVMGAMIIFALSILFKTLLLEKNLNSGSAIGITRSMTLFSINNSIFFK